MTCRPTASQPCPGTHRLPLGISQVPLVQHQDMRADAQHLSQHGVTARQWDVSAAKENDCALAWEQVSGGRTVGVYGADAELERGTGPGEGSAWRETKQLGRGDPV